MSVIQRPGCRERGGEVTRMIENRESVLRPCIEPFVPAKTTGPYIVDHRGERIAASYGMHESGYDVRLRDDITLIAGRMVLGTALEHLRVPNNMRVKCEDKSTNLRLGVRLAGRAEPGWYGHLTLELMYVPLEGGPSTLVLPAGWGAACLEFGVLTSEGDYGAGKYQAMMRAEPAR